MLQCPFQGVNLIHSKNIENVEFHLVFEIIIYLKCGQLLSSLAAIEITDVCIDQIIADIHSIIITSHKKLVSLG